MQRWISRPNRLQSRELASCFIFNAPIFRIVCEFGTGIGWLAGGVATHEQVPMLPTDFVDDSFSYSCRVTRSVERMRDSHEMTSSASVIGRFVPWPMIFQ